MTMKSLLSTVSLALLLGGAASAAQAQIAIGHLADYSGGTSDVGTPYGQGVADTFAWVNKNGGIGGKQLNVDTNDYGYQVPRAIALYKKWSAPDSKVAAIMGWGTADTEALTGFLAQDKIPDISGSYAAALTRSGRHQRQGQGRAVQFLLRADLFGCAARRTDLGGRGLEGQGQAGQAEIRAYGRQPSLSQRAEGGRRSARHRTRVRSAAAAGVRAVARRLQRAVPEPEERRRQLRLSRQHRGLQHLGA